MCERVFRPRDARQMAVRRELEAERRLSCALRQISSPLEGAELVESDRGARRVRHARTQAFSGRPRLPHGHELLGHISARRQDVVTEMPPAVRGEDELSADGTRLTEVRERADAQMRQQMVLKHVLDSSGREELRKGSHEESGG
eukprot:CAMPEP_0113283588 /NCGR_PEP_ID=MMETSP0008_2-20120614/29530_1 /TAXON_ID=97485 /ORGANISM="Prymnesium parvum" /LENGTH=143 /DNA_ID=CAMNT_0000134313 /DNA_START=403 /DNA_END=830 /DNA_ORIENTATION=+ /assembly_acc=CAM_ASM_000153